MPDLLFLACPRNNGLGISACGLSRWHGATTVARGSRPERASSRAHRSRAVASTNVILPVVANEREWEMQVASSQLLLPPWPVLANAGRSCTDPRPAHWGSTGYCTDPQLSGPAASQHSWGTQPVGACSMALSREGPMFICRRAPQTTCSCCPTHIALFVPLCLSPSRPHLLFGSSASPRQLARSARGSVCRGWSLHSTASSRTREFTAYLSSASPQRTDFWLWRTCETATSRHGTEGRPSLERLPSRIRAQHHLNRPRHHREIATRPRNGPRRPTLHRVPSGFNDVVLDPCAPQRSLDYTHLQTGSTPLWSPGIQGPLFQSLTLCETKEWLANHHIVVPCARPTPTEPTSHYWTQTITAISTSTRPTWRPRLPRAGVP